MSTDYPEAMGSDGVRAHPKELKEYLRLIEQDASYIRGLDDETELYGKVRLLIAHRSGPVLRGMYFLLSQPAAEIAVNAGRESSLPFEFDCSSIGFHVFEWWIGRLVD